VILIDANILLYAYDTSSQRFEAARSWLETRLADQDEPVGFSLLSLLAFLRLSTSRSVFQRPMKVERALDIADSWLEVPHARLVQPTERHWSLLRSLSESGQASGALLMDAHLAALAIEHGALLCSTDRDFSRFPGLRFEDPL
jgi:toxin-antitoxin system PIN domain toxin